MVDSLERIYRAVPTVECRGLCASSCGPIEMSQQERARLESRGVRVDAAAQVQSMVDGGTGSCPALINDRCSVYEDRPLICRMWGAVESMPCPHGCEATPGLLVDKGAHSLIARSLLLDVGMGNDR